MRNTCHDVGVYDCITFSSRSYMFKYMHPSRTYHFKFTEHLHCIHFLGVFVTYLQIYNNDIQQRVPLQQLYTMMYMYM